MKYAIPAFGAAIVGFLVASPVALASPYVYTTGSLLSGDLKSCLKQAKSAADKSGYTKNQEEILDDDGKDGVFYALNPDMPLSLAVRCAPTVGVVSLAVSGINNDLTFDRFKKYVDYYYAE